MMKYERIRNHESQDDSATHRSQNSGAYDLEIAWAWRETASQMSRHPPSSIEGNPADCWIKYDSSASKTLEAAFQSQGGEGTCDLGNGYVVDFLGSKQTKTSTGYVREVKRIPKFRSITNKFNIIWCWRESIGQMKKHNAVDVYGNPSGLWIKYDDNANYILESAFQAQGATGAASPREGYIVDFATMKQTKTATGFERQVQRVVETSRTDKANDQDIVWTWKETSSQMPRHQRSSIVGDPRECWIKYDVSSNAALEAAFQSQGGEGICDLGSGYVVDFLESKQTKTSTGYAREVKRIINFRPDTIWCWKESKGQMQKHNAMAVCGNSYDRWIKYDDNATSILESAFQAQGETGTASPCYGYIVDFSTMKQRKISTGFERKVQRIDRYAGSTYSTLHPTSTLASPASVDTVANTSKQGASASSSCPSGGAYDLEIVWAWKESASQAARHPQSEFAGDPSDCWIKYDDSSNAILEAAFQSQGGLGMCDLGNGYVVDFLESKQTKTSSGYIREVNRTLNVRSVVGNPKVWCWRESKDMMGMHNPSIVYGNPSDCWIKYDQSANSVLETALQTQGVSGTVSLSDEFIVHFATMKETNITTGFTREVQRVNDADRSVDNVTNSCGCDSNTETDDHNEIAPPVLKTKTSKKEYTRSYHAHKASRAKYLPFGAVETITKRDSTFEEIDMPKVVYQAKNTAARRELRKVVGWWSSNQHYKPPHVKKLNGDVKRAVKMNRDFERYHSSEMLPIMKKKAQVIERSPKRLERNGAIEPNFSMVDTEREHPGIFSMRELDVSEKVLDWVLSINNFETDVSTDRSSSSNSSSSSEESESDVSDSSDDDSDDGSISLGSHLEIKENVDVTAGAGADFDPEDCPDIMTLVMRRQLYSHYP